MNDRKSFPDIKWVRERVVEFCCAQRKIWSVEKEEAKFCQILEQTLNYGSEWKSVASLDIKWLWEIEKNLEITNVGKTLNELQTLMPIYGVVLVFMTIFGVVVDDRRQKLLKEERKFMNFLCKTKKEKREFFITLCQG